MNEKKQTILELFKPTLLLNYSKNFINFFKLIGIFTFFIGLFLAIFKAPTDYQQLEFYRIIYLHVPSAWISLLLYLSLSIFSGLFLINRHPILILLAKIVSYLGILFTIITLFSGMFWGKPTWGTFWVFDARLTSVLILLLLFISFLLLLFVYKESLKGKIISCILALIGVINLPIIKFSVDWWNTLHQPASISQYGASIHYLMLLPLLLIFCSFLFYSLYILIIEFRKYFIYKKINKYYFLQLQNKIKK
jgi:heme exporter protein C